VQHCWCKAGPHSLVEPSVLGTIQENVTQITHPQGTTWSHCNKARIMQSQALAPATGFCSFEGGFCSSGIEQPPQLPQHLQLALQLVRLSQQRPPGKHPSYPNPPSSPWHTPRAIVYTPKQQHPQCTQPPFKHRCRRYQCPPLCRTRSKSTPCSTSASSGLICGSQTNSSRTHTI
jgi:hypothetical protein